VLRTENGWAEVAIQGWVRESYLKKPPGAGGPKPSKAAQSPLPLVLVDFDTQDLHLGWDPNGTAAQLVLSLHLRNNTAKRVKAWKGLMTVYDSFGERILTRPVQDGDANINPGTVGISAFGWRDDREKENDLYDILSSYSERNLSIRLSEVEAVFE